LRALYRQERHFATTASRERNESDDTTTKLGYLRREARIEEESE